jgi:hypothetical protein
VGVAGVVRAGAGESAGAGAAVGVSKALRAVHTGKRLVGPYSSVTPNGRVVLDVNRLLRDKRVRETLRRLDERLTK